jgi:hypothetical protein
MNLYIETENGLVKNHPAFEDNLLQAFGVIPERWEPFVRVEQPKLGVYQKLASPDPEYLKINGVWTDVWSIRDMTSEEKAAKQQAVINAFNDREYASNWSAWVLDEETCRVEPPIPRLGLNQAKLDQKIFTFWCGADNNWKDTPARPDGNYKFDFFAWQWVKVTV